MVSIFEREPLSRGCEIAMHVSAWTMILSITQITENGMRRHVHTMITIFSAKLSKFIPQLLFSSPELGRRNYCTCVYGLRPRFLQRAPACHVFCLEINNFGLFSPPLLQPLPFLFSFRNRAANPPMLTASATAMISRAHRTTFEQGYIWARCWRRPPQGPVRNQAQRPRVPPWAPPLECGRFWGWRGWIWLRGCDAAIGGNDLFF